MLHRYILMQRFRDQIDADIAGYWWLDDWIEENEGGVDRIESSNHENNGRTVVAWLDNKPVAMFTVLRDMLNWSILITETIGED